MLFGEILRVRGDSTGSGTQWNPTARCASLRITNGNNSNLLTLSPQDCKASLSFVCELSIRNIQKSITSLEQGLTDSSAEAVSYYNEIWMSSEIQFQLAGMTEEQRRQIKVTTLVNGTYFPAALYRTCKS